MDKKRSKEGGASGPPREPAASSPVDVGVRAAAGVALSLLARVETLFAAGLFAFAGLFLVLAWQFGPLVMVQAQHYRKLSAHVDAAIVDRWLALEFDAAGVRVPANWRASTHASRCLVAEYGGEWGTPLRRAFCGTRVPFNDSYLLADLRDISPGVAFVWARDERGFVIPEIRIDPATRQWLSAHEPNRFMHSGWPAKNSLDWLRLELDRPVDAAIYGWTAPTPRLSLAYDPAQPADALPTGIVAKRLAQSPNWLVMAMGLVIGLGVWFKAAALLPLLSGLAPMGRWILAALPLFTLPWWMDAFPPALAHFSRDIGSVIGDMFEDIDKTDRLLASDPEVATLAQGERLLWRFSDSAYAQTMGRFRFAPPSIPYPSPDAALAALTESIRVQARALSDPQREALFTALDRDKRADLVAVGAIFVPAARDAAEDPAAGPGTRQAAKAFLQ